MIKLNEKRRRARRNLTARVATLDSGYDLEDIVKVSVVDSKAAVVDFLTLGWKINHDPTESRKPLYTNIAI